MAREMNVTEKTMRNLVKNHLKFSPHLTNLQKEKKLARAKILLNKIKSGTVTHKMIVFLLSLL